MHHGVNVRRVRSRCEEVPVVHSNEVVSLRADARDLRVRVHTDTTRRTRDGLEGAPQLQQLRPLPIHELLRRAAVLRPVGKEDAVKEEATRTIQQWWRTRPNCTQAARRKCGASLAEYSAFFCKHQAVQLWQSQCRRDLLGTMSPGELAVFVDFSRNYAESLSLFGACLCYGLVCPLVVPAGALYFITKCARSPWAP